MIGEKIAKKEVLENLSTYEKLSIIVEADTFTEEKFIDMLKDLNVKFPHIIMAQAIVESGLGTSVLFKTNHNLLGMKEALIRTNHHIGSANAHALFRNWREGVYDYIFWQLYTGGARLKSDEEYYIFLKESRYAETDNYAETVKNVVKKNNLKEIFGIK
jgi:flagellum-specific peptidoglycan hydrolase FlgJ